MLNATCTHLMVEKTVDGITVAGFADVELLDARTIGEVEDELRELAYGLGAAPLLLDFGRVRLMSSRMLGVLLHFSRQFRQGGGRLKLCGLALDLREVFRIARYDRLFEIYSDEMQALDSF
jgi:anti-sigma B factor antagonist